LCLLEKSWDGLFPNLEIFKLTKPNFLLWSALAVSARCRRWHRDMPSRRQSKNCDSIYVRPLPHHRDSGKTLLILNWMLIGQELLAKVVSGDEEAQSICPGVNTRSIWSTSTGVCTIWHVNSGSNDWFLEFGVEHKVSLDGLSEKECEDAIEKLIKQETSGKDVL